MFTVEEICEEQERQYNQLMEEDDQYCHPESFKWGFEHGVEYALTKVGWHPASELPPVDDAGDSEWLVVILMNNEILRASYNSRRGGWYREDGSKIYGIIKRWCCPPKEDNE